MTAARVVRVPCAWGEGGGPMREAAGMDLGLETAAVVDVDDLDEQHRLIADALPERPVVLGGCCCTHVGAAADWPSDTAGSPSSGSMRTAI